MAKQKVLENVYAVIGQLRANGIEKLNVDLVAKGAGLARSTFYLHDPDWEEIREVIKGKPSARVKLVEIELTKASFASRKITELNDRIGSVENQLEEIRQTADHVYRKLIDQLQYYVALASESPMKKEQQAKLLIELTSVKQEVKRLRAENQLLQQQQIFQTQNVAPLIYKRYITITNTIKDSDYYTSFLDQLEKVVPDENVGKSIGTIYVMCGLPLSGKTQWINDHSPSVPGMAIYVDGSSHKRDIRKFIFDRIRKFTAAPIHCVRVRADKQSCIERSSRKNSGATQIQFEQVIEIISSEFEELIISEPFNAIILV